MNDDLRRRLEQALAEDVGPGDVTSEATIPADLPGSARMFSREDGVLCGVGVARCVAEMVDRRIRITTRLDDGARLHEGVEIMLLSGPLRSILTAERLMLNFVQRLSGIATLTRRYVETVREADSRTRILDTRKTTPLWRDLERHAVRMGGAENHRFALYDMYLIKNNHIDTAQGVGPALERVWRHNRGRNLRVAVETRTLREVREALRAGVDVILLDNMPTARLRRALEIVAGRAETEITGGVSLRRLPTLARLGADRISVGALTHSARALDIALHVTRE